MSYVVRIDEDKYWVLYRTDGGEHEAIARFVSAEDAEYARFAFQQKANRAIKKSIDSTSRY